MAVYKVQISSAGSPDVVSLADGSTYATLEVSAGRGPKGDGWTAVTYDNNTGRFTFTSNDGLGYVSDSITGDLDTAVTEAEAAQAAAEAAQAATEDIFDQFGDQYLGPKASDPTVDNDGDPLTEGDIYFNTTDDVLKFYSGTAWVAPESIATTAAAASETASAASAASAAAASASETASAASASAASTSEANAATSASSAAASASEAAASAASINPDSIDINGGTIDGTVIGGSTPAAGSFTTGSFTGDVSFGDNDKAIFGAGSDLQIYHDSGNSFIRDAGTGSLLIRATDLYLQDTYGGNYITGIDSTGEVALWHDSDAKKLATTSTGIDVTGTVTADGLTVDGDAQVAGTIGVTADNGTIQTGKDSASSRSHLVMNNPNGVVAKWDTNGTDLLHYVTDEYKLYTAGNKAFEVDGNGDISFYEDTGTTPKMVWKASDERLGIGTSSPFYTLSVRQPTLGTIAEFRTIDGNNPGLEIKTSSSGTTLAQVYSSGAGANLLFETNASERMRIDSSGNLKMTGGGSVGWANWTITESGGSLYFATGGANKMKLDASGNLQVVGNVESNATIT